MGATVLQFRAAQSDEAVCCYNCGVEFASPVLIRRRTDGKEFWCPNGHQQAFTETRASRLEKQLAIERQRRETAETAVEWQRSQARSALIQATKAKNKLQRVEARVNAGVCTKCNRTFKQLAAHMKCKHGAAETI